MTEKVANLDLERARRFFTLLAEEPFVCLVVTKDKPEDESSLRLFSKGLDSRDVEHLRSLLAEITAEEGDNDE